MGNIILLTGEPRVGKSTAIKKIIHMIGLENCVGFYTEEICDDTGRTGFDCVSLDGESVRIADVSFDSNIRIGRYGIDIVAFETFAMKMLRSLHNSKKIIIIDEIGPIQFMSSKFKQELMKLLHGPHCVVGTIFYKEHSEIDEIKRLSGIKILTMTKENRNVITDAVMCEINGGRNL